jgi:branched-subunit amino acid transport protein
MTFWAIILGVGASTLLLRASFLLLLGRSRLPTGAQRALRFVPVSILAGVAATDIFFRAGALDLSPANARLIAAAIAALVAWRTRSTLWTIAIGMASLWILKAATGS